MGYAMPQQISNGIHFRQYSRAFILADSLNRTKVVFINADICMGSQIMKIEVGGVKLYIGITPSGALHVLLTPYIKHLLLANNLLGHKKAAGIVWRHVLGQ